jgi:hypothetical protein
MFSNAPAMTGSATGYTGGLASGPRTAGRDALPQARPLMGAGPFLACPRQAGRPPSRSWTPAGKARASATGRAAARRQASNPKRAFRPTVYRRSPAFPWCGTCRGPHGPATCSASAEPRASFAAQRLGVWRVRDGARASRLDLPGRRDHRVRRRDQRGSGAAAVAALHRPAAAHPSRPGSPGGSGAAKPAAGRPARRSVLGRRPASRRRGIQQNAKNTRPGCAARAVPAGRGLRLNRAGTPHEARRPSRRILRTGPGATCWPAPVPGRAADGSAGVSARTWGPQGHVAPGHAGAAGERRAGWPHTRRRCERNRRRPGVTWHGRRPGG